MADEEVGEAPQWHRDLIALVVDSTTEEEGLRVEEGVEEAATAVLTVVAVKTRTMTLRHQTRTVNGEVRKTHTTAVRTVDLRTVVMGPKSIRTVHHTTTVMIRISEVMKVRC